MTLLMLLMCSIGAWADDGTTPVDPSFYLVNKLGGNAMVTFYTYAPASNTRAASEQVSLQEIVKDIEAETSTLEPLVKGDDPTEENYFMDRYYPYVLMHIVPKNDSEGNYWTDEALLYGNLATDESLVVVPTQLVPGQLQPGGYSTRAGVSIGDKLEVNLIQLDANRYDGAGWYYMYVPELASDGALGNTIILNGFVLPKFDLSAGTASTDGKTYTFTVEDSWTTTLTIDEGGTSFTYNGSAQGPTKITNTSIVVKNGSKEAVTFNTVSEHVKSELGLSSSLTEGSAVNVGSYVLTLIPKEVEVAVQSANSRSATTSTDPTAGIFINKKDIEFEIKVKDMNTNPTGNEHKMTITVNPTSFVYNGAKQVPEVKVYDGEGDNAREIPASEYDVSYKYKSNGTAVTDPTNAAEYTIVISNKANKTNGNYNIVGGTAEFTITPKEVGLTWDKTSFEYNGQAQQPKATVTGVVKINNQDESCNVSTYSLAAKSGSSLTESKAVNAGNYTATATALDNANYKLPSEASTDFTITATTFVDGDVTATGYTGVYDGKAHTIEVTAPKSATVKYGTAEGSYTLTAAPTYTDVSNKTVYFQVTMDNYNPVTGSQTVVITPKPLTATLTAANKVYDGKTTATMTASVETGIEGETLTFMSIIGAFADKNVGTGKTVTKVDGGEMNAGANTKASNYDVTVPETAKADITAKPLTITAEAKTKVAGQADPALTYTSEGLVSGDAITGSLKRAEGEDVGTYAINQGDLSAGSNYTISYTGANFTITSATFVDGDVTAEAYTGVYDAKAHTITLTAPKSATVKYGTAEGTYNLTAAPTYTNVGTNTVYFQVTMANYNPVTGSQTVTITKAPLAITADAKEKKAGEADPELTYTAEGLVGNDKLEGALSRTAGETAGEYDILQGTLKATDNYEVTYKGAKLTITADEPTVQTFKVVIAPTTGGTVIATFVEAAAGQQVNLKLTPDAKFHLAGLVVVNNTTNATIPTGFIIDATEGPLNFFLMPGSDVTVTAIFEADPLDQNIFIFKNKYGEIISHVLHAEPGERVNLEVRPVEGFEDCVLDKLFVINNEGESLEIFVDEDPKEGTVYFFFMKGDKVQVYNSFKGTNGIVDESQPLPPDNLLYLLSSAYTSFLNTNEGADGVQLAMSLIANILATFTPEGELSVKMGDDVNMALLNLKSGWQIKFDFTGLISVLNPEMLGLTDGAVIESGKFYEMLSDGRLDLLLNSEYLPLLIKSITIMAPEPDDPTAIGRLKADGVDADIFDLRGRKVDVNTLRKGIYIKNGKKVVIK